MVFLLTPCEIRLLATSQKIQFLRQTDIRLKSYLILREMALFQLYAMASVFMPVFVIF